MNDIETLEKKRDELARERERVMEELRRKRRAHILEQQAEAQRKEAIQIEESKAKLSQEHGLDRNKKFDRAYEIAWDHGHASGFDEVENYFADLADLLKA